MVKQKTKSPSLPSVFRQPVVAILGHVDHGKTTLLDYIRQTHRATAEVGGITQSIGAYQAEYGGKKLTFIDTPGHAAFGKMRSRGASVADIAVLVVDAGDGVKPQTSESIKYIKAAGVPFIVAINKMDKPGVTADQAKAELTQEEVFVEGYGGNTPVVTMSAKTGQGVDTLLENILLLSELEELPYKPSSKLVAPVIEAKKDMKKGIYVSTIVMEGTIHIGDALYTPSTTGKVKALYGDMGQPLQEVLPGQPCQIMGFRDLPEVGETITNVSIPLEVPIETDQPASPDISQNPNALSQTIENRLNIILRADTAGSLEAITGSLSSEINIISSGTGDVNESDVMLAVSTRAIILGFSVRAGSSVMALAEADGVVVKTYRIIYELLEYLEKKVLRLLEPTIDEEELGRATIIKMFEINKDRIAGSRVDSGKLSQGDTVHVLRKDGITKEARIKSIRVGKEQLKEVGVGKECGIMLFPNLDISEKDVIMSYKKIKTDED